jgi:hypothetical protein
MFGPFLLLLFSFLEDGVVCAYSASSVSHLIDASRRSFLAGLLSAATIGISPVLAAPSQPEGGPAMEVESVYFGVGCFWHIQHEFVAAERDLLGRTDRELTALTGYAGGTKADAFQRVCYHNFQGVADYGKLGHGEVVGLQLPTDKIVAFAAVYFSLFNPETRGGSCRMDVLL